MIGYISHGMDVCHKALTRVILDMSHREDVHIIFVEFKGVLEHNIKEEPRKKLCLDPSSCMINMIKSLKLESLEDLYEMNYSKNLGLYKYNDIYRDYKISKKCKYKSNIKQVSGHRKVNKVNKRPWRKTWKIKLKY